MTIPEDLIPSPFQPCVNPLLDADDFIDVCGQAVPTWLSGTDNEYKAFRTAAGMIDFSMLYKWDFTGPGAVASADAIFSRNLLSLKPGQVAYGVIVTDTGMMMDDCTAFKYANDHVMIVGGNLDDEQVMRSQLLPETELTERRSEYAVLSFQGPVSRQVLQRLTDIDLSNEAFPYYTFRPDAHVAGIPAQINRLGFTAELGYEIMVHSNRAVELWNALLEAGEDFGVIPCAADALMRVRVEAGMVMGGLEYDATTSPFECRMGWAVDLNKSDFHGRSALTALKHNANSTVVSLIIDHDWEGLDGMPVLSDGDVVGHVTMAVLSPHLGGQTLALARIAKTHSSVDTKLSVAHSAGHAQARVVSTPVYDPERTRVRS